MNKIQLKEILYSWNLWGDFTPDLGMLREQYLSKIDLALDSKEIIVLKGIRRAGKSTLLLQYINRLHQNNNISLNQFLYVNFEDFRFAGELSLELLEKIYQTYREEINPHQKAYLFLDEIQNIPSYEKWIRTYYDRGEKVKFIISGSSAVLLSRELATLLTGRNISFTIFPFTFTEHLDFIGIDYKRGDNLEALYLKNKGNVAAIKNALQKYAFSGGFPEVNKRDDINSQRLLLQQYVEDIIYKDVILRHNIRNSRQILEFAHYCLHHVCTLFSFSKLAKIMKMSPNTIIDFISYFKEAYLLSISSCYSYGSKSSLDMNRPKKLYAVDNGLPAAVSSSENFGRMMENLVFQSLKVHEIFYGKGKHEVDLVLKEGGLKAINVSYEEKIKEREIRGLEEFAHNNKNAQCYLITEDEFDMSDSRIKCIPLWVWLINQGLY